MKQSQSPWMPFRAFGIVLILSATSCALAQTGLGGNPQQPATTATSPNSATTTAAPAATGYQSPGASNSSAVAPLSTTSPATPPVIAPAETPAAGVTVPQEITPVPGAMPKTTVFSSLNSPETKPNGKPKQDVNDLIGPLPKGKVAFIGGMVTKVDHVRNRISVKVFKGNTIKAFFDDRSRVYKNGVETTQMAVHKGDRVYLDTQLDKNSARIFARNLRIVTDLPPADASGQLLAVDDRNNTISLQDKLSGQPVTFRLSPTTVVKKSGEPSSRADLAAGSLVSLTFVNTAGVNRGTVKDINVIAAPGARFTLYGEISHLDIRTGKMGVRNKADDNFYSVNFDPARFSGEGLKMGAGVVVDAVFNGRDYDATAVTLDQTASDVRPQGDRSDEAGAAKKDSDDDSDISATSDKQEKKHRKTDKQKSKKDKNSSDSLEDDMDEPK